MNSPPLGTSLSLVSTLTLFSSSCSFFCAGGGFIAKSIAFCARMSYNLPRASQKRTCLGRPRVSIGDAPLESSCAQVSKDAENLCEVHVDEQDRVDRPERRTRDLGPSLPDKLWLWKCAFQRRHDIWYLVHHPGQLLGCVLGFFLRVSKGYGQVVETKLGVVPCPPREVLYSGYIKKATYHVMTIGQ